MPVFVYVCASGRAGDDQRAHFGSPLVIIIIIIELAQNCTMIMIARRKRIPNADNNNVITIIIIRTIIIKMLLYRKHWCVRGFYRRAFKCPLDGAS
jgi:hypothetical protein